jgi:hypothetical protein
MSYDKGAVTMTTKTDFAFRTPIKASAYHVATSIARIT